MKEQEIKQLIQTKLRKNEVIIGKKESIKAAKEGLLDLIVYAKNTDEKTVNELKLLGIRLEEYIGDSEALSILCGKPFNILVLGIKR